MAEIKTKLNDASVEDFLNSVEPEQKRADSFAVLKMMSEITGEEPKMWGDSIIGLGINESEWFITGFSPRKQNLTLYIMGGYIDHDGLLEKLGKHKTSKACLYIKKLADVDESILHELIKQSVEQGAKK